VVKVLRLDFVVVELGLAVVVLDGVGWSGATPITPPPEFPPANAAYLS
jgi:hypothetical protein